MHRRRRRLRADGGPARAHADPSGARLRQRYRQPAQCAARALADRQRDRRPCDLASGRRRAAHFRYRVARAPGFRVGSPRGKSRDAICAPTRRRRSPKRCDAPGRSSTLIVPSDCQWSEAGAAARPRPACRLPAAPDSAVRAAAEILRRDGANTVLFMGGPALRERGLNAAARIAAASGCRLMCETFPARVERGGARPPVEKLPYFPEMALDAQRNPARSSWPARARRSHFSAIPTCRAR